MKLKAQLTDIAAPVYQLKVKASFEQLSAQEKLYAHHMARYKFSEWFDLQTLEVDSYQGFAIGREDNYAASFA